jgi:hypothetical protein
MLCFSAGSAVVSEERRLKASGSKIGSHDWLTHT